MKHWIIWAVLSLSGGRALAQVVGQQATQHQLQERQLAAIQLYAREMKQGYQWVQKGLQTISTITHGEWNCHIIFLAALSTINPQIFSYVQNHPPLSSGAPH